MNNDPAFLFYSKDWLEGTADLTKTEKGTYVDLLCFQHQRKGLPTEIAKLARMVGLPEAEFNEIWKTLSEKFKEKDGKFFNAKLVKVTNDRKEHSLMRTILGTFGAQLRVVECSDKTKVYLRNRFDYNDFLNLPTDEISKAITNWLAISLAKAKQDYGDEDVTEDVSVSKTNTDKESEAFNIFRLAYPGSKRGNETEFKNFKKKNGKEYKEKLLLLLPALHAQKAWREAQPRGAFVPQWKNLQTWINQSCWEQEMPKQGANPAPPHQMVGGRKMFFPDRWSIEAEQECKTTEELKAFWDHLRSRGLAPKYSTEGNKVCLGWFPVK